MARKLPSSKRLWMPVLVTVLILQLVAIAAIGALSIDHWRIYNRSTSPEVDPTFRMLIRDAASALYSPAVVDAKENLVYIPELKIRFPLNEASRNLVYSHQKADTESSWPEGAYLHFRNIIINVPNGLQQVPCLQKAARVTVNAEGSAVDIERMEGKVTLQDGRVLFVHTNQNTTCKSFWYPPFTPEGISELMQSAQSY